MTDPEAKVVQLERRAVHGRADAERAIGEVAEIDSGAITQDGVAQIFARRFADRLRYCHSTEAWFEWTGTHWRRDKTAHAYEFVRLIARELSEGHATKDIKAVRRTGFADGVEKYAKRDPALAVTADQWDRDPMLLGTPDGTVDLRTGELRPGSPADGITKLTAAASSDAIDCPLWLRFLDEATGADAELIRFLQLWAGYCLTGHTREHSLFFGYGAGGNGKTVYLNVHTGILAEYAITAPMDAFTAAIGERHPTDLAMLRGARLVAASETEQGRAWAETRIKQLTGGDAVTARFMRNDFFTFTPTFKLMIVGNHQPTLHQVDDAVRRRFNIVPFTRKPGRADPELADKLRTEWPGILRWMIRGCLDWQQQRLTRPPCVAQATDDYFANQDIFGQWLGEHCEIMPGNSRAKTTSAALYQSWKATPARPASKPRAVRPSPQTFKSAEVSFLTVMREAEGSREFASEPPSPKRQHQPQGRNDT